MTAPPSCVEIQAFKRQAHQVQESPTAFYSRPQQQHAGVCSRRISSQVGERLVACNEPASLSLNADPQELVGDSLPSLTNDRRSIVPMLRQCLGHLPWQILVNLDGNQRRPLRLTGTKSAVFTASAANFRAALMSSRES